jgi:hypothetical protein
MDNLKLRREEEARGTGKDCKVAIEPPHRVAKVLSAKGRVVSESEGAELGSRVAESPIPYRVKRSLAKQPRHGRSRGN